MLRKHFSEIWSVLVRHQTFTTSFVGSAIVGIWTILRHITNGINFDVVGQVGVTEQWVRGLHGGVVFGSTNYLLKMPFYALVNLADFLAPTTRLLVLALACSIGAFLLIYYILRKILLLYDIKSFTLLNISMVWLATISGRVFWVDYANSRNLEVAGGLAILYLLLLILKRGVTWRRLFGLFGLSSVVFFADPLQLYIIGGGMSAAFIWIAIRNKNGERLVAMLSVGVVALGAMVSRLLAGTTTAFLPVSYLVPPKTPYALSGDIVVSSLQNAFTSTLRIFDINVFNKAFSVNSIRQLGSMLLLGISLYILIRYRKGAKKIPTLIFLWLIIWNYLVYMGSGNAQTEITERYLILVPVLLIATLGLYGDYLKPRNSRGILWLWIPTIIISSLLLFGAIILRWPARYALDRPMFTLANFAQNHHYDFIVTSQILAIPSNYYAGYDSTLVPTVCSEDERISTSNLFYDQGAYNKILGRTKGTVAVIIPKDGITSGTFHCSAATVLKQLGSPKKIYQLTGVGYVYEYDGTTSTLREL